MFARTGRIKETMAALALICDLPVDVVRRLMSQEPDAALILCQAAGFSPAIARMIVEAADRGAAPGIGETLARLNGLSAKTAQGVVGFWRAYRRAA